MNQSESKVLKFNDTIFAACLPAYKAASENAKTNGTPYGITITTTPNNLDIKEGAYCKSMIDKACKFVYSMFDMNNEELTEFVANNSENDFIYVEYSYKELGRTDEWLKQMTRELNGDMAKIKREILLEWPKSMESSVFNEETLDRIYHFVKQTPETSIVVNNYYIVDFYEKPDFLKNYILACDVSGGLSNDRSVISIIDPETFKPIGLFKSSKIDTDSFKKLIYTLMTLYFKNSILVVERNSYGLNILDSLMKDPVIEPRMYRETRERIGEKTQNDGFTVKRKTKTVVYGVNTTVASRKMMFDLLMTIVDEEYDILINPELYKELVTLERKKTGKIEHADGAHDDVLMSYLIFRFAVFYGTCFRDRFKISPIPSRGNVKTEMNENDFRKVEKLLNAVNYDASVANFRESELYSKLLDKQSKINEKDQSFDNRKKLTRFRSICNLNKDE